MNVKTDVFRAIVTDAVIERIAIERRAGFPQGLTNRSFESITTDLLLADWEALAETMLVDQCIDRMCGTERKRRGRQHRAQDKRRST